MPLTLSRVTRRAATAALAGVALIPLAGCGGDEVAGAGAGEGLARLAPASSAFYFEAAVRPDGDLGERANPLIEKFAPGQTVERLVVKALEGSKKVDYARDIKPWLGERAAGVLTGVPTGRSESPDGAALIEVTDADKALATLRKYPTGKLEDREYGGVKYIYDAGDQNVGAIVEETLVVGTEAGFKAIVDTSKGEGLDTNAEYGKIVDKVDDDAIGFVYGDIRRAFDLAKASASPEEAKRFEGLREYVDRQGVKTFAAGLAATETSMKVKVAAVAKDNGQADATARTLAALPAGSWAALGLGDLGKSLSDALDQVGALSGAGFDVQEGLDQLEQQSGVDVQKDLLSWMGQSGLFVRGTSLTEIGGALVVQSKDPAATKAALAKARTLVAGGGLSTQDLKASGIDDGFSVTPAGAPVQVFAALAGERFVLAVGRPALDAAIDPASRLEDDDTYKAAAEQLGDGLKPSFLFDFPKVGGLIGAAAGGDPDYAKAKPYLDKIGTVVAGSEREGDMQLQTLVVGVR